MQLVGDHLLVLAYPFDRLLVLDPATGKVRRTLKIPSANHFRVFGDRLVLLHGEMTVVRSYPARKPIAKLHDYRNSLEVAMSPDGRYLSTSSNKECFVYDTKRWKLLHTIEGDVAAVGFTGDGRLLLGSRKAVVRVIDPKTGKKLAAFDAAPERARKPSIEAFACTPKHIAISRVDGTTALVDARTRKILRRFEKHVTQHYFGPPVVFSQDGATLWVGACPKGPVGLSGYDVRALSRATS